MLNVAVVMGRLTADPELRHTASGLSVTSFTLAVDRNYSKAGTERQTDWIDVVAWRQTAEFVCKYFTKGQMMAVNGTIQTRSYEDKNGNKRKAVEIVAKALTAPRPASLLLLTSLLPPIPAAAPRISRRFWETTTCPFKEMSPLPLI